jgi:hypothetical protein
MGDTALASGSPELEVSVCGGFQPLPVGRPPKKANRQQGTRNRDEEPQYLTVPLFKESDIDACSWS